ncbi:MAG: CysE/LacA/LpxA/NodL family acetyltransferase [Devosia sp.]|uniref:putative colanic acid biosynthesis acetyltransferase n=1 Tax=Devosia sp. TaxID=1871048 RepID=UPI00262692D9|nr:putative colanic acid biosynthesis acetyltransferase [Devosia sp.]MDB5539299.1 CysE/LacA/LpxA/NodL family acetyltransferase [Devosia sp.]
MSDPAYEDIEPVTAVRGFFEGAPSFPLRHRLFRLVWNVAWALLAAWTPPPLRRWRVMLLNLFGAAVDRTASVYGSARIWYPPNLSMGARSVMGPRVTCYCMARISIGERVVISQGAHLCAGSHRVDHPAFALVAQPIDIGPQAWIAAEAFVGPGVTVGAGAVLGARGVAFKALEAWTIHVGNPARPVRPRHVGGNSRQERPGL